MNTSKSSPGALTGQQAPRVRKSVMLSPGPHRQLEKMAKQLKVKNTEFVEAAIAYFHETGQSPFVVGNAMQAGMERKVEQQAQEIRQHTTNTGLQLEAIMRDAERALGKHLQEQQGGTLLYLERIERTILTYLTKRIEEQILLTLLKQEIATTFNRGLLETLLAKHRDTDFPLDENKLAKHAKSNEAQIEMLMVEKNNQLRDAIRLAPVLVSKKPEVAAPSQPSSLTLKKAAAGAGKVSANSPSAPVAGQ